MLFRSSTSFSAFVTLVDYFPNIRTLRLGPVRLEPDEGPIPPLSRPLQGEIHVRFMTPNSLEFFTRLAKLDLEYEGLVIEHCVVGEETKFLESVLQLSPNTVKYLRLISALRREHPYYALASLRALTQSPHVLVGTPVMIGHLRQLRELEVMVHWTGSPHESLLSSIASTELRKIILTVGRVDDRSVFQQGVGVWASIDKQLCELVARLGRAGHRHTLEVEVQLTEVGDGLSEHDFTGVFPEFREKGVTTIIDAVPDPSFF